MIFLDIDRTTKKKSYAGYKFGNKCLTWREVLIAEILKIKYLSSLSQIFKSVSYFKLGCEFLSNSKTKFEKLNQPVFKQTVEEINGIPIVLAVGDTSFIDYKKIIDKRDRYDLKDNDEDGLILHSCLAVDSDFGQPLGLLWEKIWYQDKKVVLAPKEISTEKQKPLNKELGARENKAFGSKKSYCWIEALQKIGKLFSKLQRPVNGFTSRIIHVFDSEDDIPEVFLEVSKAENTGVIVRDPHNRFLSEENSYLWKHLTSLPVEFLKEVKLTETKNNCERTAILEVRYCPVSIQSPSKLENSTSFNIYAVYAKEIDVPQGCEPVDWILLTSESVTTQQEASQILRWYRYRLQIKEYHQVLKSGCKVESYPYSGESISTMLGFATVVAAKLLRITYLYHNSPQTSASAVLTKTQIDALLASAPCKLKNDNMEFTINWAIRTIAWLGGYFEHRTSATIGIQVLWRGWLELETLCQS